MSKGPIEYLRHILDECKFILSVTSNDFSNVWDVVINKIPEISEQIAEVIKNGWTSIKINDLLDLRIDTAKVEFVMKDQRVKSYDFSVFERQELEDIYGKLEKVKLFACRNER